MFDEYPDRMMVEMVVNRICDNMQSEDSVTTEEYSGKKDRRPPGPGMPPPPPGPGMPPPPPPRDDPMRSLIGVILNNEMYRRRCRHRRCRRWW